MAHLGGGGAAEANSSLVLTTDTRPRDTHEPTGEPEKVWGKIDDPKHFGGRAYVGRPPEHEEKLKKSKECDLSAPDSVQRSKRRKLAEASGALNLSDQGVYQPKTKETRAAYEALLSVIQQHLGGQQQEVLCDAAAAANEVLAVLKNEKVKNSDKKKDIEKFLNAIPNTTFDHIVSIGRLITDYKDGSDAGGSATVNADDETEDDISVAVKFEEEEDDEHEQVQDMDGDNGFAGMHGGGIDEEANEGLNLNVQDIYAYWLQGEIAKAYPEIHPQQGHNLAEELLQILAEGGDNIEVENRLLVLLDFERFDLINILLQNRLKIVWCTRLARAESQDERKEIEEEMMGLGPGLVSILEQLHATTTTAKERHKILEKNTRLKESGGGGGGGGSGGGGGGGGGDGNRDWGRGCR